MEDESKKENYSKKDIVRLSNLLEKISEKLETSTTIKNFQTEVFTQMLKQMELTVCLLEKISKQTCESLNELHYQTDLQKSVQESLNALLDINKTSNPQAAIEYERLKELNKRIEMCCPSEQPKPICEYSPCDRDPSRPEGSTEAFTGIANSNKVSGAQFPHIDIHGEEQERNEDIVPKVPIGPLRGSLSPTVQKANLFKITSDSGDARLQGAAGDPVIFDRDDPFGNRVTFSGIPPDMSGAMSNDVVFMTGNTFAALSTDGGNTFNPLDPTTIFPSGNTLDAAGNLLDRGLCCDQVVQYVPGIDRFIWLMQFCGAGPGNCLQGVNKLRIASASPEDIVNSGGTSWTYWDLASGTFNSTFNMDYPDMSIGNNHLYISVDAVSIGLLVVRIPLQEIQRGGTINFNYTNPAVPADRNRAYGGHITQNTGDELFWAGHNNTSQLNVFSWRDNSNTYFWRPINIDTWVNTDYSSRCPDNTDWLNFLSGFPGSAILGATRKHGGGFFPGPASEIWFAWTAARGGGFPHPYVRVVQIDTINWSVTNQWQIWNPDHAFAYPSLATNSDQEVGISLGFGGNTFFASHAVGMLGDFIVWYSELSDAAINRWGDYVTVRQASPRTRLYAATGYSVLTNAPPATGTRFNPRYILFGRSSAINPPIDPLH